MRFPVVGQLVESEGHDRSELDLPGAQLQLLKDAIFYSQFVSRKYHVGEQYSIVTGSTKTWCIT